jgi:ATP:corrinoid adenosyltransferase
MTKFGNAACSVCLGIVMIYTGNGKGRGTNTVYKSIKEVDEEMKKKKNNSKGEKR